MQQNQLYGQALPPQNHCGTGYGQTGAGYQGNLMNNNLGECGWNPPWRPHQHHSQQNQGYVIDSNRNGRYDRGRDGVLAFDMNRDGRIDRNDINRTNDMMQAATGNFDLNGDGRVSRGEMMNGRRLQGQYRRMDRNRDGVLDSREMNAAGGRVWVDSNRNGGVGRNELHSVFNMPNGNRFGPSQRLDAVNPFQQASHTSNNYWGGGNQWGGGPFYGGGGGGYYGGF